MRKRKRRVKPRNRRVLLRLFLLLFAGIQLYPLIWLAFFSLKDNREIFGGNIAGFPQNPRWNNYLDALTNGNVLLYFGNSVLVTAVTILAVLLLSSMTAFAITRMRWKLSRPVLVLLMLGMMIPGHAALLPLFKVLSNLKLLNSYAALIIPYVAFGIPMALFIFNGFMAAIPKEMEEAAAIDGCNIYRIFYTVILPLIRPAIATVAIFTFISTWNELMFAVTFISKTAYRTLTVGIMSLVGGYVTRWGPVGAGLMVATIPTLVIYGLLSDQVQKSMVVGAVKG